MEPGATLDVEIVRANGRNVDGVEFELRYEPRLDPALRFPTKSMGLAGTRSYGGLQPGRTRLLVREGAHEVWSEPLDLIPGAGNRVRVVLDF